MKPIRLGRLLICIFIPLAGGGLAALFSGGMSLYETLTLPPLSPPGWVFPVVWTILYLLMGIAAYIISDPRICNNDVALRYYYAQLAINFLWPIVFFRFKWFVASCVIILILLILELATYFEFRRLDHTAAKLLIPYLIWTAFAAYLTIGVTVLN